MNINEVLLALANELPSTEGTSELYICGGAALNLLGVSSRQTADIDVLSPKLDGALSAAAGRVAEKFGLRGGWLNNGPDDLLKYLEKDWKQRAVLVFEASQLKVYSLSRQELLNSKIWAACDRLQDIPDVVAMFPTYEELKTAREWVLQCDASEVWPDIVEQCLVEIGKRLDDERA